MVLSWSPQRLEKETSSSLTFVSHFKVHWPLTHGQHKYFLLQYIVLSTALILFLQNLLHMQPYDSFLLKRSEPQTLDVVFITGTRLKWISVSYTYRPQVGPTILKQEQTPWESHLLLVTHSGLQQRPALWEAAPAEFQRAWAVLPAILHTTNAQHSEKTLANK